MINVEMSDLFKSRAAPVSTVVVEALNLSEALAYAVTVCERKDFCETLIAPDDSPPADAIGSNPPVRLKTLAAPGLPEGDFAELSRLGEAKGLRVIEDGLRNHLAGLEVGFSLAHRAIAETATVVLACREEEVRLASMISETHILALPKTKIVRAVRDIEGYLREITGEVMYTAFISGCSRTSDIERVLTLGVHGPLELHVVLLEE